MVRKRQGRKDEGSSKEVGEDRPWLEPGPPVTLAPKTGAHCV